MKVLSAGNKAPVVRKMSPGYTKFDMSHAHKLSGDMGYAIPICCMAVMPGDRVNIGVEGVIRFMPMIASPLHEVWATFDYFHVPYRIIDSTFTDFITGGEDGLDSTSPPRWTPSNINKTVEGSLWDNLGFPTNVIPSLKPVAWPLRAYNAIWNWQIRNQNLQSEVNIETNEDMLYYNWENDYFTSQVPWQQRGVAPALPISGTISAGWAGNISLTNQPLSWPATGGTYSDDFKYNNSNSVFDAPTKSALEGGKANVTIPEASLEANTIDLSGATTFDIADLREALQIQRFLEINARSGARFNEFLEGQFSISPVDKTLQEPEFIGRTSFPVLMDEVLQTSSSGIAGSTPQGTIAGKGIAVGSNFVGSVRIEEPGLIMGLMTIRPKPAYQQGIDRPWLIQSKYDYPFPVFANLSEQKTMIGEIYVDGTNDSADFGGYAGRYDEYRIMHDSVHGLLKKTTAGFSHWHMGRIFASQPALNADFVKCDCSAIKTRIMAVPTEPTFIANVGNQITVTRALPLFANPSVMEKI